MCSLIFKMIQGHEDLCHQSSHGRKNITKLVIHDVVLHVKNNLFLKILVVDRHSKSRCTDFRLSLVSLIGSSPSTAHELVKSRLCFALQNYRLKKARLDPYHTFQTQVVLFACYFCQADFQ